MSAPICPKCGGAHRGSRSVDVLHAEGCQVLIRAHHLPLAQAAEWLRSQWLGGALELADWCADCRFREIAATSPDAREQEQELDRAARATLRATGVLAAPSIPPTEEEIERAYIEGSMHTCLVIPLFPNKQKVARDLLDIGSPKGDRP